MFFTGIGDEAGVALTSQIEAARELGWNCLEMRAVRVGEGAKANVHDLPEAEFDRAVRLLTEARVGVYCFGSAIMNWAKTVETPWEVTVGEVQRCIPRMKRLGTKYVRIMSLKPTDEAQSIPKVVFERVREVTQRFVDEGLVPVHENCMNYGGMSSAHALELLDRCPGLKWVFDTANPVFNADRSKAKPWPRQDAWEFWQAVRDHVVHIHVKDATWNAAKNDADYNWPGEGEGKVREILGDALRRGYAGGVSIEPHMVVVFHDANSAASSDEAARVNFVEYGRRLESLVGELRSGMGLQPGG
jgi:sugar phosphate isomerase/epimerase